MQKMSIFYSSETNKIEIRLEYDHFYSQNALYFANYLNSQFEFHFFDAASLFGQEKKINETFHGELCKYKCIFRDEK